MGELEIVIGKENLSVDLPANGENYLRILADPTIENVFPQLQFCEGSMINKSGLYQKTGDVWEPLNQSDLPKYLPGSIEHSAFEKITEEAKKLYEKNNE